MKLNEFKSVFLGPVFLVDTRTISNISYLGPCSAIGKGIQSKYSVLSFRRFSFLYSLSCIPWSFWTRYRNKSKYVKI